MSSNGRVERHTFEGDWLYAVGPWSRRPRDLPVTTTERCSTCNVAIQLGGYCRCSD